MKPEKLPPITVGLDVLTPESDLPAGAVRKASNVLLRNNGGFDRRPGYDGVMALPGAHSHWQGRNGHFIVANGTLYKVDFSAGSLTSVFTRLPPEDVVELDEVGSDLYFTSQGVIGKYTGSVTRRPGVADLIGSAPTVAAAPGSMPTGRYGVAYSLVNDLGEESGLSDTAWVEGTGFTVSGITTTYDVVQMKIYATSANGSELMLCQTLTWAASATITGNTRTKSASRQYLVPMPGGDYIAAYRGRLFTALDVWLTYSPAFDYGVTHVNDGWMQFGSPITMLKAVESGLFVGFADRVVFLRGDGPQNFQPVNTVARGCVAHSAVTGPADHFSPDLVPAKQTTAVWLSPQGIAIGRADGSVELPQADRIRLSATSARGVIGKLNGISQAAFMAEDLTLATPDDTTDLLYASQAAVRFAGHGSVSS